MKRAEYITLIEDEDEVLALVGIQRAAEHDADLTPGDYSAVLTTLKYHYRHLQALEDR